MCLYLSPPVLMLMLARDWYMSARAVVPEPAIHVRTINSIAVEGSRDEANDVAIAPEDSSSPSKVDQHSKTDESDARLEASAAQKELQFHELLALFACFLLPLVGAWLLHAIRSQLSRPSEGLVSNYNLTVFLLASEIRPTSHLIKMIQARTLYLQRVVKSSPVEDEKQIDPTNVLDMAKRLEELEAHVADSAVQAEKSAGREPDTASPETMAQIVADVRKSIRPELDALNRAVRRYEKRTTISAVQTEARLHDLESRLKDVVALAAAAQRSAENQPQNFMILINWLCGAVIVPVQLIGYLLSLPSRAFYRAVTMPARVFVQRTRAPRDGKGSKPGNSSQLRDRKAKSRS